MRRVTGLYLLLALTACGGSTPTNPPPPPPPNPPASLAIQAGDGQQAEPGVTLPVKPAVIVRDASGRPVAGTAVVFAVDSGGGTLTAGSALTGTDGVATAGDWKLGPTEGRNTLRVTAGALPPVQFGARAVLATTTVATATLPASGGTLTVTQPGSPLDGFQLTLPAGAVNAALAVTVRYKSSASVPLPDGQTALSPLITVQSDGTPLTTVPFTMRLPINLPAGGTAVVTVVDSVTGFLGTLPVIATDPGGITVASRVLDGAQMRMPSRTAPSALRTQGGWPGPHPLTGSGPVTVQVVVVTPPSPHDMTSGFTMGRNDWEFDDLSTAYDQYIDAGQVLTEWLNIFFQPLYGALDRIQNVRPSNPGGIMLAAGVSKDFNANLAGGLIQSSGVRQHMQQLAYHVQTLASILTALQSHFSVPLLLVAADGSDKMVLAIGWSNNGKYLRIADPSDPLVEQHLSFSDGVMTPYPDLKNPSIVFLAPVVVSYFDNDYRPIELLLGNLFDPQAVDHFAPLWPVWDVTSWSLVGHANKKRTADTLFMLADTTRVWTSAANYNFHEPTILPLKSGYGLQPAQVYIYRGAAVPTAELSTFGQGVFVDYSTSVSAARPWIEDSLEVYAQFYSPSSGPDPVVTWMGWQTFITIKFAVSLPPVQASPGVPFTVSLVSLGGPSLPPNAEYQWDFHDPNFHGVIGTVAGSVTYTYATSGTYPIDVIIAVPRSGGFDRIATTHSTATVAPPGEFIKFDIAGTWDPTKTPANGNYQFPQLTGARSPSFPVSGVDGVSFGFDFASDNTAGVIFFLIVQPGAAITAGETFSKGAGPTIAAGQFTFFLATDLTDPGSPNSTQGEPGGTGTCTITSLAQLSDGTFVAHYSFSILNAAGGTIIGSGVGSWK